MIETEKSGNSKVFIVVILQLALVAILVITCWVQWNTRDLKIYIKTPSIKKFKFFDQTDLAKPLYNEAEIVNWLNSNFMVLLNFNYHTLAKKISYISEYLSPQASEQYMAWMKNSELNSVIRDKAVVTMVPRTAPEIIQAGLVGNKYVWKIYYPISMRLENRNTLRLLNFNLEIFIARCDTKDNPDGVRVEILKANKL